MTQNSEAITEKIDTLDNINTNKFCMSGKKLAYKRQKDK